MKMEMKMKMKTEKHFLFRSNEVEKNPTAK